MAEKTDFSKISFLIVDSNEMSANLLRDILAVLGAKAVRHAASIDQAIRRIKDGQPDVVITENYMDGQSGLELVDWIRNGIDSPERMTPVIMVTASSEVDQVIEARDKGINEFLSKPFTVEALYSRLVSAIARPRSFVNVDGYFGPDRRRRQTDFSGEDRRRG